MEDIKEDLLSSENELGIDNEIPGLLIDTAKWAKFVAVTIFIIAGICVLLFISFGSNLLSSFTPFQRYGSDASQILVFAIIMLIIIAVVVVVTYYFLLNFANKVKAGIESENIELVNGGLKSLKTHFIIIGILSMLALLFSIFGMVGN